jgi:hypothetical protein
VLLGFAMQILINASASLKASKTQQLNKESRFSSRSKFVPNRFDSFTLTTKMASLIIAYLFCNK